MPIFFSKKKKADKTRKYSKAAISYYTKMAADDY